MTQIEKLKKVLEEINDLAEGFETESAFCRDHNFKIESQILYDKHRLVKDIVTKIEMVVIKEIIPV
jgi:hypothetical protein